MKTADVIANAAPKCSYQLERLLDESWDRVLGEFQDATIFQSVPFVSAKAPFSGIEHLIVRDGMGIVSATQIRLVRVPMLRSSIAYVLWGPLCRRQEQGFDLEAYRKSLNILKAKYVDERRMCLRIVPPFIYEKEEEWLKCFENEGYLRVRPIVKRSTIILNINRTLDDLRKGLDKKWRNCLSSAEKTKMEIIEGSDQSIFQQFQSIYGEMLDRKKIAEPGDIAAFKQIQERLPDCLKMRIFLALDNGKPCAGAVCSAIGRRGLYLFGATADAGMKNRASYLVQWRIVKWLKERGCSEYDLHGSNAKSNPGVYAFKMGLCGNNGKEVSGLGYFEAYPGIGSRLLLTAADRANHEFKRLKNIFGKYERH